MPLFSEISTATTVSSSIYDPIMAGRYLARNSCYSYGAASPRAYRNGRTIETSIAQSSFPNNTLHYIPMSTSAECLDTEFYSAPHPSRYRCCCNCCHVVVGTKIFLVLYIVLSICGLTFGVVSACVWLIIPIIIVAMTIYSFYRNEHKYLYPFLIISVVQLIVCLVMSLVVVTFAIFNYETLKLIIAHSAHREVNSFFIVCVVGATVAGCFILAILHLWQCFTIYNCLQYYEYAYKSNGSPTKFSSGTSPGAMPSVYENKRISPVLNPDALSRNP